MAAGLDRAHTEVASILTYNDESSLGAAISLAYYSAKKGLQADTGVSRKSGGEDLNVTVKIAPGVRDTEVLITAEKRSQSCCYLSRTYLSFFVTSSWSAPFSMF